MDFRLLGPLEIRDGDVEVPLRGAKQRTLLAILLLQANTLMPADRLVELIWGSEAPETASNVLQVYVSHVRRALDPGGDGREMVVTRAPGYELRLAPDDLDVRRFERRVDEGTALTRREPERAIALLREAQAEWRGPALAEFAALPFAVAEARRLEERRLAALAARVEAELALGRHTGLVSELEAIVTDHPLREDLRAHLMLALYRSGRQAEALATCDDLRRRLRDDLGIDPGPEIRRLERAILVQDPALAAGASTEGPTRARAASGAAVDVLTPGGRELVVIRGRTLTIGRGRGNDLVLDGDGTVSRRHAEVVDRDGTWVAVDLGSSNGTLLNGDRVSGEQALRDGDELVIGSARLVFHLSGSDDATLAARSAGH